ncbi:hypothetical protein ACGFIX_32040 [Nocardia salmonicida]|uniref:hypothetical protein n=1 Tax=Nocardia salmonicida TaxID=53431 RepID=UPI00371CE2A9
MTIHRPGRPEDLPEPETLWARWAFIAAVRADSKDEALSSGRTGHWLDTDGLHWDDAGCTWWTLSRMGEGRFVLFGEDESSWVKFHEQPIDVLAGGPAWLRYEELLERVAGYEVGSVYWYDDGAWARAPYPDDLRDDGLDCGMSALVDRDELLRDLIPYLDEAPEGPSVSSLLADAEACRLDAQLFLRRLRPEAPLDPWPDIAAAARTLAAAGINRSTL